MTLDDAYNGPIRRAYELLPAKMATPTASIMLLTIGLQESRFKHRRQIKGPARGFWQFERMGGVHGVMNHHASKDLAIEVCHELAVTPTVSDVYNMLEHDDILAAAFARLLLWTDPFSLPGPCDAGPAWDLYLRTWRPGKPHHRTWGDFHREATEFVTRSPIA